MLKPVITFIELTKNNCSTVIAQEKDTGHLSQINIKTYKNKLNI